jgi:uncharacterized protein (DUF58 family)
LGPVRLTSSDPFGWLECEVTVPAQESLVVYPLIAPLEAFGFSSVHPLGEYVTSRRLLEDPLRVVGVRDYVLGDDPRRIHWKATAHAGALRSKVYDPPALRRLLLLLDVWNYSESAKGTDLAIQELTIAAAASLGVWALDEGYLVGLLANCSMVTPSAGQALSMSQTEEEADTIKVDREVFSARDLSPPLEAQGDATPPDAALLDELTSAYMQERYGGKHPHLEHDAYMPAWIPRFVRRLAVSRGSATRDERVRV